VINSWQFDEGPQWQSGVDGLTSGVTHLAAVEPGDGDLTATTMIELGDGVWHVWARVYAPDLRSDRFYGGIASQAIYRVIATQLGRYHWVHVGTYVLSEGGHRIGVGTGEVGLRLDCLVLDPNGLTPAELDELVGAPEHVEPPVTEPEPPVIQPPVTPPAQPTVWSLKVRPFGGTYRNGKAMSGEERRAYDGILNYWRTTGKSDAIKSLRTGNSYAIGRGAPASALGSLDILLRLVGDARLLDLMAELGNEAIRGMRRTWAPGTALPAEYDRAPHGELMLPWLKTKSEPRYFGQDYHLSDAPKAWSMLSRIALALRENRGAASPAGHDYAALADKWRGLFAGYERVWSAVNDAAFPAAAQVPRIYRGRWVAGNYTRAARDEWPTNMRASTHSNWSISVLTLNMGRILGKPETQSRSAVELYVKTFMHREQGVTLDDTGYGPGLMFPRGTVSWAVQSEAYEMPTNYGEQVVPDAVSLYLDLGADSHVTLDFFERYARNVAGWLLQGPASNFTVKNGIAGMASRTYVTPAGETRKLPPASEATSVGSGDRTDDQYAGYGLQLLLPWDPDGKLAEYGRASWLRYGGASGGSIDRPIDLYHPTGLLLRGALA